MQNFKENLVNLRKKNGFTQTELANLVGVSAGAVSKWECGHAYPDISILAPLARALHTTLDQLLQFQKTLTKEEVRMMKQEMILDMTTIGYLATQQKINQRLREYPHDLGLKLAMASLLYMNLPHLGNEEDLLKNKISEIGVILKEIIDENQAPFMQQASYMYAIILMDDDQYEECEKLLEKMMTSSFDITTLYLNLYQRQKRQTEVIHMAQQTLLDGLMKATMSLSILARNVDDEKALILLQDNDQLYEKFQFSFRQSQRDLMKYYLEHKQYEAAAEAYACYVQSIIDLPLNRHDNLYFSTCVLQYDEHAQQQMRIKNLEMEMQDDCVAPLYSYPAYQKALKNIQKYLKANT